MRLTTTQRLADVTCRRYGLTGTWHTVGGKYPPTVSFKTDFKRPVAAPWKKVPGHAFVLFCLPASSSAYAELLLHLSYTWKATNIIQKTQIFD